jgi:hypothetical protein
MHVTLLESEDGHAGKKESREEDAGYYLSGEGAQVMWRKSILHLKHQQQKYQF